MAKLGGVRGRGGDVQGIHQSWALVLLPIPLLVLWDPGPATAFSECVTETLKAV